MHQPGLYVSVYYAISLTPLDKPNRSKDNRINEFYIPMFSGTVVVPHYEALMCVDMT